MGGFSFEHGGDDSIWDYCFCDMYFFMDQVGKGLEEAGIRGILTRGLIEESGKEKEKLEDTRNLYRNWNGKGNGRIKVMVALTHLIPVALLI